MPEQTNEAARLEAAKNNLSDLYAELAAFEKKALGNHKVVDVDNMSEDTRTEIQRVEGKIRKLLEGFEGSSFKELQDLGLSLQKKNVISYGGRTPKQQGYKESFEALVANAKIAQLFRRIALLEQKYINREKILDTKKISDEDSGKIQELNEEIANILKGFEGHPYFKKVQDYVKEMTRQKSSGEIFI